MKMLENAFKNEGNPGRQENDEMRKCETCETIIKNCNRGNNNKRRTRENKREGERTLLRTTKKTQRVRK